MANYRTKIILDNSSHIIFNDLIKTNCLTNNHIYLAILILIKKLYIIVIIIFMKNYPILLQIIIYIMLF